MNFNPDFQLNKIVVFVLMFLIFLLILVFFIIIHQKIAKDLLQLNLQIWIA